MIRVLRVAVLLTAGVLAALLPAFTLYLGTPSP